MDLAVKSQQAECQRVEANHERKTVRGPPASVIELQEGIVCIVPGRHHPEDDDHYEEPTEVKYSQTPFNKGQPFSDKDVDKDAEEDDGDGHEGRMEWLRDVVGVVQDDKTLYNARDQEANAGDGGLPSGEAEPTGHVTQVSLAAGGRLEWTDAMVSR